MKCTFCENEAKWVDPRENNYLCKEHADLKLKELDPSNLDTLKDWFLKVIEEDPNLINIVLNTKTGEVNNANN